MKSSQAEKIKMISRYLEDGYQVFVRVAGSHREYKVKQLRRLTHNLAITDDLGNQLLLDPDELGSVYVIGGSDE